MLKELLNLFRRSRVSISKEDRDIAFLPADITLVDPEDISAPTGYKLGPKQAVRLGSYLFTNESETSDMYLK